MSLYNKLQNLIRGHDLTFIGSQDEGNGVISFRFEVEPSCKWKAGQHGIFKITHKKISKSIRPFSISSASDEGYLEITTKINTEHISDFKSALNEMTLGTSMKMYGPAGKMHIHQKRVIIMIAKGIGITPFRAIVQSVRHKRSDESIDMILIHLDPKKRFLFQSQFEDSQPSLKYHPVDNVAELVRLLRIQISTYGNQADYLLSGSSSHIKEMMQNLKQLGIDSKNIKKDPFYGLK